MKWHSIHLSIPLYLSLIACYEEAIPEKDPGHIKFQECLVETGTSSFDIVTWNLQEFPKWGDQTIEHTANMIKLLNADLIALQEISDTMNFNALLSRLQDWDGYLHESYGLSMAVLYKITEVNLIGTPQALFQTNNYAFPRSPLLISAIHQNGLAIFLINVHLKCCDGLENERRRREAGRLIKEYIDDKLANEKVMILGDFNDEISLRDSAENVFYSLIADSINYAFADMDIALNQPGKWSYPTWPSHIDHILITDELFSSEIYTATIPFDRCDEDYLTIVSDHRPLMIRLTP